MASRAKKKVTKEEFSALMEEHGHHLDFDDLLPLTLQLNGKPMDVKNRRPMLAPMFRKHRTTKREIYLCGRQLGKSSQVAASIMMNMLWRSHFREMYVAPLALYAQKLHHDYMSGMVGSCQLPWPIQDRDCVSNVNQKSFTTKSRYIGVSCFNSARSALGSSIDSIRFDEVQDLNIDFIPQILETMRTSDYRWETYTGTARGIENTIQTLYDESSGGEWHMRCGCKAFGRYIVPTRDQDAISMIQKHGIACPDCSKLLDTTVGEWVHRYPDRLDPNIHARTFAGYHIPATIVSDVCQPLDRYLETIYDKLYGISRYSESRFLQEVLGISTDQGGRPITLDEIRRVSVLEHDLGNPDLSNSNTKIRAADYLSIAGGADWGGAEVTSFTVGTIVGFHAESSLFHCLGATSPRGVPDEERHFPLAAFFRKLGPGALGGIGADSGFVGSVQNKNLQRTAGVPVLGIGYGTKKLFYQLYPANQAIVDRTTLIWIVYQLLKDGKLLLPKGPWFENLSRDLLATYVQDVEAPNGVTIRRYCRYSQKADDFLHALGYAIFVCALRKRIDLPSMIGLEPKMSANASYIHIIGEEADKSFGTNAFSQ